jgi:hypothetical protein
LQFAIGFHHPFPSGRLSNKCRPALVRRAEFVPGFAKAFSNTPSDGFNIALPRRLELMLVKSARDFLRTAVVRIVARNLRSGTTRSG